MYRLMNDNCDQLLAELARISDVPRYLELRQRLRTTDVAVDLDFQNSYRDYWRMGLSRPGRHFYRDYFDHMQALKATGTPPSDVAIREIALLSDTPERPSLQFSFATKMLNTLDAREPVYDTHVTSFYFFVPPASDRRLETRLDALLEFYNFLRGEYARVIREGLLADPIHRFRERFATGDELPGESVVDMLIWGFVTLLRKGAQQRGDVLYR